MTLTPIWSESSMGTDIPSIRSALAATAIPQASKTSIQNNLDSDPALFQSCLSRALADRKADPMLLFRVDKEKALPSNYVPGDLLPLDGTGLSVSRPGHYLRNAAFLALKDMDSSARSKGITLLVSSSYRSFAYQSDVWNRNIAAYGEVETAASVARPGHSQHQMGTAIDFGSISDAFAATKASQWLSVNASRFGFSLSYPRGLTATTGYQWESWHYRYIGKAAATLETRFFGGVQQYLLLFLEQYP